MQSILTLTLLGTGAAVPIKGRFNVAFTVQHEDTTLLVESGPGILYQLQTAGIDPCEIEYLFVSHHHGDHALGFPMLVLHRIHEPCAQPLEIICPESSIKALKRLVALAYPGSTFDQLDDFCHFIPHPTREVSATEIKPGLTVSTLPTIHSLPGLALRLDYPDKSVVYSADTAPSPDMPKFAAGSDLLIHDSNFSETLDPDVELADHSTARAAAEIARSADVKMLTLVHIHNKYAGQEHLLYQEAASVFSGKILVPGDFSTLVLT